MSLSDWIALLSLSISLISIGLTLYEKYKASKLETMNLSIRISNFYFSMENERLYIEFAFINESSLPITISNSEISSVSEQIPDTKLGFSGGTLLNEKVEIDGSTYSLLEEIPKPLIGGSQKTRQLPITLKPFESKIIFLGYHAGCSAPFVLPYRDNDLKIQFSTTRDDISGIAYLEAKTFEY